MRNAWIRYVPAATDEVQQLREENAVLRAQIEWLKRQLFGAGRSEKLDRAQLLLRLAELEKLTAAAEAPKQTITYERTNAPREKRPLAAETFAKLPVKETIEIVPEPVQAEPERYERIGEERTFEVDVVPPQLFKREIVRPKFKRRDDREQPPVIAPAPARPVQGGYASAGLLAWIALSKYVDHAPLYRLEQMSARWGASISRQTMADWIAITAQWLEPIYRECKPSCSAAATSRPTKRRYDVTTPTKSAAGPLKAGCGSSAAPAAMSSSTGDCRAATANSPPCSATIAVCFNRTPMAPIRRSLAGVTASSGLVAGRMRGVIGSRHCPSHRRP